MQRYISIKYWLLPTICLYILSFSSCDKLENEEQFEDCSFISNAIIISESVREMTCTYERVYQKDGKLFSICECCNCDKIARINNCSGEDICANDSDCTSNFIEDADYLFSIIRQ